MKIIVSGAAGFIGSHLAEKLVKMSHEVIGVDSFTNYYSPALKQMNAKKITKKGVKMHNLDLVKDDLSPIIKNSDFIFHLAGQPGINSKIPLETYIRNNIMATNKLLMASAEVSSLKCFVNASTSSVYGKHATDNEEMAPKPTSYYGVTKLAAEQLVLSYHREEKISSCSLRLFSVYGPRERPDKIYPKLIQSILSNKPFTLYKGSEKHKRSYTYVNDIVEAFVKILKTPNKVGGEIINIGSDVERTTGEGIRIVENILGKKARIKVVPKRPGDQFRTKANIEKARKLLDYNPTTTLEKGLKKEINWYKRKMAEI